MLSLAVALISYSGPTPCPPTRGAPSLSHPAERGAPAPQQRWQRSPRWHMSESRGEKINDYLQQLDAEVAAYGEMRAAERKTAQERRAMQEAQQAQQVGKVTVFGARLDDDIAGQEVANKDRVEQHEQLFEAGIKLMRRGEYKDAVTAFTRAVAAAPGGMGDRKGGQYAIYLAQALGAADRKQDAVGLLKRCEAHPDADVRKIADNVLYIMQAPELKIDSNQFVSIEAFDEDDWSVRNRKRAAEQKDPPPEKYSLEWYMLEGEKNRLARERAAALPPQRSSAAVAAALLAGTVVLGLVVGGGL